MSIKQRWRLDLRIKDKKFFLLLMCNTFLQQLLLIEGKAVALFYS